MLFSCEGRAATRGEVFMKKEDKLFFVGLFSLTLSLFLTPFGLYLMPAAWLGWQYSVPDFVLNLILWTQVTFHTTYGWAFVSVARLFVLPGVFFGAVAYLISHRFSKMKLEAEESVDERELEDVVTHQTAEKTKDSLILLLKITGIAAFIFIFVNVMQMLIAVTPAR
ncbi:MAG: hypothetical protein P1U36_10190 [Legionellaceae bacterium]|nr:hypothetical protein [Legionellaceae bacterium]